MNILKQEISINQFNEIRDLLRGGQIEQFNYAATTFNTKAGIVIEPYDLSRKMLSLHDLTPAENEIHIYISDNQAENITSIINENNNNE